MSQALCEKQNTLFLASCLQVLMGSIAIAIGAQIAVYLPWSPVPITGQTLAVALVAGLLGPRRGVLAVLAYLAEGLIGLPVFAGGTGGLAAFFSPRLGYLIGFIPQAFIVGAFWQSSYRSSAVKAVVAHTLADISLLCCGVAVLGYWIGYSQAFWVGVVPFVMGNTAKTLIAVATLRMKLIK